MGFGGFSWKRAVGISAFKSKISRAIGVPLTKSGRQRKIGAMLTGGAGAMGALAVELCNAKRPRSQQENKEVKKAKKFLAEAETEFNRIRDQLQGSWFDYEEGKVEIIERDFKYCGSLVEQAYDRYLFYRDCYEKNQNPILSDSCKYFFELFEKLVTIAVTEYNRLYGAKYGRYELAINNEQDKNSIP